MHEVHRSETRIGKEFDEPWQAHSYSDGQMGISDCRGRAPLYSDGIGIKSSSDCPPKILLERIAACVNFCREFPTKFLQSAQMVNTLESPISPEEALGNCFVMVVRKS